MLSRKKLKLEVALAVSGCHRPQWKRGKRLSFLSSTGTNLLSTVNMTLKFSQKASHSFILLGLMFALVFSHSHWFKEVHISITCIR